MGGGEGRVHWQVACGLANGSAGQGWLGGDAEDAQPIAGEPLLERPGDVRSVPFAQRWAAATAGSGPGPQGPPGEEEAASGWGAAAATSGSPRDQALPALLPGGVESPGLR